MGRFIGTTATRVTGDHFVNVRIDMTNLPTLPERMDTHFREALIVEIGHAADRIIHTAQESLHKLGHAPGAIVGPHVDIPGGLDTGRLRDSLTSDLVEGLLATGVWYDLLSDDAPYWQYIEFGHWVVGASPWFWEGYHFLESAIMANIGTLKKAVRAAWSATSRQLASEARVMP